MMAVFRIVGLGVAFIAALLLTLDEAIASAGLWAPTDHSHWWLALTFLIVAEHFWGQLRAEVGEARS